MDDTQGRVVASDAGAAVSLRGVSVGEGPGARLSAVSLDMPLGARTVVIGPNGSGKTSLLHVMHGLLLPDRGEVCLCEASGPSQSLRPGSFGFVLQKPVMLARTAQGNVEHALAVVGVPRHRRAALARGALERVGLLHRADHPARLLSGGEQQRVSIARACAIQPRALLLDEPTAHLDPGAVASIERHLLSLSAAGLGLVISTHDLGQARRLGQFMVLLHRGRVEEAGPADRFFAAPASEAGRRFLAGQWLE